MLNRASAMLPCAKDYFKGKCSFIVNLQSPSSLKFSHLGFL